MTRRREREPVFRPFDDPGLVLYLEDELAPPQAPQPGERVRLSDGRIVFVIDCEGYSPHFSAWDVWADEDQGEAHRCARMPQHWHLETWVVRAPADDRTHFWQEIAFADRSQRRYDGRAGGRA